MTRAEVPDPAASEELVRRAQHGDRAAFDDLLRRSQPQLVRLVRSRLGPMLRQFEDSEDVVQSALAEAVRGLPDFDYRGAGSFLRWLSTIVEYKIRHHARERATQKRDPARLQPLDAVGRHERVVSNEPSPSEQAAGLELEERYHRGMERLGETDRELLALRQLGSSYQEIAAALGSVSAAAVQKRVARLSS